MLETAFAQLRHGASLAFGLPFSTKALYTIIKSLQQTRREFGAMGQEGAEILSGPELDQETRREVQLRRFRQQARHAAATTAYYGPIFKELNLDPARLTYDELARLPMTSKEVVKERPDDFVSSHAQPSIRATTTGTTGQPTSIYFSSKEIQIYSALTAISYLTSGDITSEDIVHIGTSARGMLGNVCVAGGCGLIGAMVYLAGVLDGPQALEMLTAKRRLPGKKERTSVIYTYPSHLGEIVEYGLKMGYGPADFGLERIIVGGEIVTKGLKERAQKLFGPVRFLSGYGMTEIWPFGGTTCEKGHLHFEASQGIIELYNPDTDQPAQPGEYGAIVATPLPPYRETTLLLRYNTQDMVQVLETPPSCSLKSLPATGQLMGKLSLSVKHDQGRTFPRQILEAVEAVEAVPLPGRCGFWAVPGGVAVEVLVRHATSEVHREIEQKLIEQNVPLQQLFLVENREDLRQPLPLRGDLKENGFQTTQPLAGLV